LVNYQWGIFWADLNPSKGSEQAGQRPVLVISADEANQVLPIITILSLTSMKQDRNIYPTETYLKVKDTGLSKDSIAMAHQIRAISKERLGKKCGTIKDQQLQTEIRNSLKIYLDL